MTFKRRKALSSTLPSWLKTHISTRGNKATVRILDADTNRVLESYEFSTSTYSDTRYKKEAIRMYMSMLASKRTKLHPLRNSLDKLSIRELKTIASIYRIPGYGNLTKDKLLSRVKWFLKYT